MKRVKYIGEVEVMLPALHVIVRPNDELDVPDDFENALFILVETKAKKGDK